MCHGVGLSLLIPELFFYGIFAVCFDFFRNGASGRFFSAITNLQSDNFSNFSSLGETLAIFGGSTFSGIVSQGPKFKTKKQFWNQKSKPHTKTHGRDHLLCFIARLMALVYSIHYSVPNIDCKRRLEILRNTRLQASAVKVSLND